MSDTAPAMKPGDLIRLGLNDFWQVAGVHLGAVGQESVVELVRLNHTGPTVHGKNLRESLIPERLLRALLHVEQAVLYSAEVL